MRYPKIKFSDLQLKAKCKTMVFKDEISSPMRLENMLYQAATCNAITIKVPVLEINGVEYMATEYTLKFNANTVVHPDDLRATLYRENGCYTDAAASHVRAEILRHEDKIIKQLEALRTKACKQIKKEAKEQIKLMQEKIKRAKELVK